MDHPVDAGALAASIVIPALNEEKLLPQLLDQFPPALRGEFGTEIVVADGGSTDRTREIACAHGCAVAAKEGGGRETIAEGRNRGAAHARGAVLVFLNADVRVSDPRGFLEAVRECMADPGIAGATARVRVFPEEETAFDRTFHTLHTGYIGLLNAIGDGMGRGECQVVRAPQFRALGGYRAALVAGEDYDLFRRVRRLGRIRFLPAVVVYESPRRYRARGYGHIVFGWFRNAVSVVLRQRSSSEVWEAVR
jgi:glycosyltransferase involved in cell wall biosynthesis